LQTDAWSLDSHALERVLAEIDRGRRTIVECGSGLSTIVIARRLVELGEGHLYSLEHDPAWARLAARRIAAEGLDARVSVIDAPLAEHPLAEPGCRWYSPDALDALPRGGIELLLVDGPPAGDAGTERSRYPALPVLAERLADGASVILDDVGRDGERWVLDRWEAELGIRFERREGDGIAIGVCCAPTQNAQAATQERGFGHDERNSTLAVDRDAGASGIRRGRSRLR
jgi:hypothetical protein